MLTLRTISVDGQVIRYATEGQGPVLLLLHSFPFDYRIWQSAIPYLSGHYRVIAPDLPGFGGSPPGVGWNGAPDSLIRPIAGLLTALQIVPCRVAGVSLGGAVALGLAARYPERIRDLVLLAPPGIRIWPRNRISQLSRLVLMLPGLLRSNLQLMPRLFLRWLLVSQLARVQPDALQLLDESVAFVRAGGARRIEQTLQHWAEWRFVIRQIRNFRTRSLLVWGERDTLYSLGDAEQLRRAMYDAQLKTLPQAGHLLPLEYPAELASLLRSWFDKGV